MVHEVPVSEIESYSHHFRQSSNTSARFPNREHRHMMMSIVIITRHVQMQLSMAEIGVVCEQVCVLYHTRALVRDTDGQVHTLSFVPVTLQCFIATIL